MTITLRHMCHEAVPSVTSRTSDILYTIAANTNSPNTAVAGTVNTASTTTNCAMTKILEIFDDDSGDWVNWSGLSTAAKSSSYPWIS